MKSDRSFSSLFFFSFRFFRVSFNKFKCKTVAHHIFLLEITHVSQEAKNKWNDKHYACSGQPPADTCHSSRHIKNMYYFHETNEHSHENRLAFLYFEFQNLKRKCSSAKMIIGFYDSTDSKVNTWAKSLMNEIVIRDCFALFPIRWNGDELIYENLFNVSFEGVEVLGFSFIRTVAVPKRKSNEFNH